MNYICWNKTEKKIKGTGKLPLKQRAAYGVGHVLNDLVSSVWFSYLIIYLTKVVELSNRQTGLIILLGQIADGIFTPFIGIICDRTVCRYGRRKVWHLIGSVLVTATFPLFLTRLLENTTSDVLKMVYYVGLGAVFQFGWGCVQISHLSLIPEISRRAEERVELNAIRSAITFLCGIYVYGVTWLMLGQSSEYKISPVVWREFMYLSFIVIVTGNIFNIVFHVVLKEPFSEGYLKRQEVKLDDGVSGGASVLPNSNKTFMSKDAVTQSFENTALENQEGLERCCIKLGHDVTNLKDCVTQTNNNSQFHRKTPQLTSCHGVTEVDCVALEKCPKKSCVTKFGSSIPKSRLGWLKCPALYKTAVVYMCTRLVVNISQSYLALYLTETLNFEKEAIAYFPLIVLISGVFSSFMVSTMNRYLGSKITYIVGASLSLGAYTWFYLKTVEMRNGVYATAVFMGSGGSVMLVTSLSLISELVGEDKTFGAFIYGAVSFCDKLSSGIVIAIIQELNPRDHQQEECAACNTYIRQVQALAPGVAAMVGLLTVVFFYESIFVCKKRVEFSDAAIQVNTDQPWAEFQDTSSIIERLTPHTDSLVLRPSNCIAQVHCNNDNKITQLGFETRF